MNIKKIPPPIQSIKFPIYSIYHKNIIKPNKSSDLYLTNYYKDRCFYNSKNLNFQLNLMKMFSEEEKENNFSKDSNNLPSLFNNQSLTDLDKRLLEQRKKYEADMEYYKKVFKVKGLFKRKGKTIDNKLNLVYAENEEQYILKIEKQNEKRLLKGLPPKNLDKNKILNAQINNAKDKIKYMKAISDWAFPGIVVAKIKLVDKKIEESNAKKKENNMLSPVQIRNIEQSQRENKRRLFLSECIKID
jgi:hypothetical protein